MEQCKRTLNPPAKHHYIPVFYLRGWEGPDARIERFTRPYREIVVRRVPPTEIGWQKNLYASPETNEAKIQWLEQKFFTKLDNAAAVVLNKLKGTILPDLNIEERSIWSTFMMSLLHRTPENLGSYIPA